MGLGAYWAHFGEAMPQRIGPMPDGTQMVIPPHVGGKLGQAPIFGINTISVRERPLNPCVAPEAERVAAGDSGAGLEPPIFRSPCDRGVQITGFPPPLESVPSMYDFWGSSSTLNDHSLAAITDSTLIPWGGGKMPFVRQPAKTCAIGSYPIYNYAGGIDRGTRWYGAPSQPNSTVLANLLFMDLHAGTALPVPTGIVDETPDYRFRP